jgi:predicted GTPase
MESTEELENQLRLLLSLPLSQANKDKINNLMTDMNDELILLISGEFKAGKSTFINALIGEKIVKSDIAPATAVITKLVFGSERKFAVHFKDGTKRHIDEASIHGYTAEESDISPEIRSSVTMVEIQLPLELLRHITIVDSPGLGSIHNHHTTITESYLNRADAIIWLFNYTDTGLGTELETINTLKKRNLDPILVVNKIDNEDEEEEDLEEVLEDNRRRIKAERLYGVSAKMALEGKLSGDEEAILDSNWLEMEKIIHHLILNRSKVKQQRTREKTLQFFQTLVETYQKAQHNIPAESKMKAALVSIAKFYNYDKELAEATLELTKKQKSWNLEAAETINEKLNVLQELTLLVPQQPIDFTVYQEHESFIKSARNETVKIEAIQDQHLQLEKEFRSLSNRMLILQIPLVWQLPRFKKRIENYHLQCQHLDKQRERLLEVKNQLIKQLRAVIYLSNDKIKQLITSDIARAKSIAKAYNRALDELKDIVSEDKIDLYNTYALCVHTLEKVVLQLLEQDLFQPAVKDVLALLEKVDPLKIADYPELKESLAQAKSYQKADDEVALSIHNNSERIAELFQMPKYELPKKLSFTIDDLNIRRTWIKRGIFGIALTMLIAPGIVDSTQQQEVKNVSDTKETDVEHSTVTKEYTPADLEEEQVDAEIAAAETETLLSYYDQADIAVLIEAIRNNEDVFNYQGASHSFTEDLSQEESALLNAYNYEVPLNIVDIDKITLDAPDVDTLEVFVTEQVSSGDTYYHTYRFIRKNSYYQPPMLYLVGYEQEADVAEIPNSTLSDFVEEFQQQISAAYDSGNEGVLSPYLSTNILPGDVIETYINEVTSSSLEPVSFMIENIQAVEGGYQVRTQESYQYETQTSSVKENRSVLYDLVDYGNTFEVNAVTVVNTSKDEEAKKVIITEDQVANFTMEYYQQFNTAYNAQVFEGVSSYLYEGSSYYNHMRSNIHADRLFGTSFENRLIQMKEFSIIDDRTIEATMYAENIYTYAEDDIQFKAFDFKLVLHRDTEGGLSIEESKDAVIIEDYAMGE